jgi:glutamyl-Q tRNA(Asp) synthetase
MARAVQGRLLLRIEDIDRTRCRPEFAAAIRQDLAWLGIELEPEVRRQSEHLDDYRKALGVLRGQDLIYPSFESRSEILRLIAEREKVSSWRRDPDGAPLYPGDARSMPAAERERRIAGGEPFALRLATDLAVEHAGALTWSESGEGPGGESGQVVANPSAWGDVVLARKEMPTSYHLAVVVDDALQGVTHVVRGQDLFWSTSVHRLLQALLGLPAPTYRHHRLVRDAAGRKLAKSTRATALRELRAQGCSPADIRRMVGLG